VEIGYPIALKFGTQKGYVRVHLVTKFGWTAINTCKTICDYSRKIPPICFHAHRVTADGKKLKIGVEID